VRALLIVVVLAACRPAPPVSPFTLRVAVSGRLNPVSPSQDARSWTSIALPIIFQSLLTVGPKGEIVPLLASRTELMGSHGLRIWLRSDARFSDGSPVTYQDVADSLAGRGLHTALEQGAMIISSEQGAGPTEMLVAEAYVFRRAGERILGSGPFRVEEESPEHILLTRVVQAPGLIAQVRLDSYATWQDAFARTLKGDADMLPEVQPRWVEFFEGVPRLRILRAPGSIAYMVALNRSRLSRGERMTLAGLLSSDEVRRVAFGDECVPPSPRPGIEPLPPGPRLDVLAVTFFDRFASAVRRALGVRGGTVQTVELQEFVPRLKSGDFDLATVRPRVSPPVSAALVWHTGASTNLLRYSNPVVDAALDARDWAAAQRELEADPPGAIVCTPPSLVVLDARIKVASFGQAPFMESLPQWEVAQ
jgi:hypothetical protein